MGNPYATHLPVLLQIPRQIAVKRILEFGSGMISTLAFLDNAAYPDLVSIDSYENNEDWFNRVCREVGNDPRSRVHFTNGPISDVAKTIEYQDYDLIFIDDSATAKERSNTIRSVVIGCAPNSVVVIHDYENIEYVFASDVFPFYYVVTGQSPHTGVLWKIPNLINADKLAILNNLMVGQSERLAIKDIGYWLSTFDMFDVLGL